MVAMVTRLFLYLLTHCNRAPLSTLHTWIFMRPRISARPHCPSKFLESIFFAPQAQWRRWNNYEMGTCSIRESRWALDQSHVHTKGPPTHPATLENQWQLTLFTRSSIKLAWPLSFVLSHTLSFFLSLFLSFCSFVAQACTRLLDPRRSAFKASHRQISGGGGPLPRAWP